jgi:hypothetical protein
LFVIQNRQAALIGTGVPITVGNTRFIATATHVIREAIGERLLTLGTEHPLHFSQEIRYYKGGPVDVDVSTILLTEAEWRALTQRYTPTTAESLGDVDSHPSCAFYIAAGYPYSKNRRKPGRVVRFNPVGVVAENLLLLNQSFNGKNPGIHFGLRLGFGMTRTRYPKHAIALRGMSGGGVWRFDAAGDVTGSVVPRLVGIAIENYTGHNALIFSRVSAAVSLACRV